MTNVKWMRSRVPAMVGESKLFGFGKVERGCERFACVRCVMLFCGFRFCVAPKS